MNILVIGQGGREHALVHALRLSQSVKRIHALPGSDGIAEEAQVHSLALDNHDAIHELIRREKIDLVVIGPEVPLADGLSDALRLRDVLVFGPSHKAAQLESSKIFSKEFMVEAGVSTAAYQVVSSVEETKAATTNFTPPYVLKADGLAAGKGVFICKTEEELLQAAHSLFHDHALGKAGERALLEQFQPGYEISYLVLTNGDSFEPFVLAQDHKRLNDNDQGPNTGGMGVVAPVEIDPELRKKIDQDVIAPVVKHLKKRDLLYRGVLYVGLMMTSDGPSVLEFNVRFGDPEAQVILPLLDGDWGLIFQALAKGELLSLKWKNAAAACVVMAAEGYPDAPVKGTPILGLTDAPSTAGGYFLHAGTKKDANGQWVTAGGRVLNAVGVGANIQEAVQNAYKQSCSVAWQRMQVRSDIGAKVLSGQRG